MKTYEHTQRGTVLLVALGAAAVVALVLGVTVTPAALVTVPVLVVAAWLFSSLTIEVTEDRLRWYFGPGVIRKEVLLADIASAQRVRTNLLEGWGIHLSRYGWLYNVSGFDAVAVDLNGSRRFALGTDEPDKFVAVLRETRGPRPVTK